MITSNLTNTSDDQLLALGQKVVQTEADSIITLSDRLQTEFVSACRYLLRCTGKVIVIGMGKSGHIAKKISATLASTGTPAFFIHPSEAGHGDLGMIGDDDLLMILSNSGETDEIVNLLPILQRLNNIIIAIVGNPTSTLAKAATVSVDASIQQEACPMDLAPTTSTTVALIIGDALAITVFQARGNNAEDFARAHPSGNLGRRLLLTVEDVMHQGQDMPFVRLDDTLQEALLEMTKKHLGTTAIVDEFLSVQGIFTDGDLRRAFDAGIDLSKTPIKDLMNATCKTIPKDTLAVAALHLMEQHKINALLVTDKNNTLLGILNMHNLLKARIL